MKKFFSWLALFLKGAVMGIANVIPGVSGGTLAVIMGIYDKFISAISNIFKDFIKNLLFLLPIVLGMGAAIIISSKVIPNFVNSFIFILVNDKQYSNDDQPIDSTVSGEVISFNDVQYENAKEPIVTTVFGIVYSVLELPIGYWMSVSFDWSNKIPSTDSKLLFVKSTSIDWRLWQFVNAPFRIDVMVDGMI